MRTLSNWNKWFSLWQIDAGVYLVFGTSFLARNTESLDKAVKSHVQAIDHRLEDMNPASLAFMRLLRRRFLTRGEYEDLIDGRMQRANRTGKTFSMRYWDHLVESPFKHLLDKTIDEGYLELFKICLPKAAKFFFSPTPVPLPISALDRHMIITGRTGSGKTEFLKALFYQLQKSSHEKQQFSMVLLDPHGDVSEQLLGLRLNTDKPQRLMYVDAGLSRGYIPCLNPFWDRIENPILADLLAQQWSKAFSELIPEAGMSLQMETLLKPCLAVMFASGGCGLKDLQEFMDDATNAGWIEKGRKSANPVYRSFFENAFPNKKYALTKLAIYTRLQHLANNHYFHAMMNGRSTVDMGEALATGKVVLFNLSKGKLGEETSRALGKFVSATILSLALQRAFSQHAQRKPCYLFIDEFHNLASSSMQTIFSEARKYRLHLIVGTQSVGQLPASLKDMVLNNTGVKLMGINGLPALKLQAPEIGVSSKDSQKLEPYHFYLKYDRHPALVVKSPDFLLGRKEKQYFVLPKELKSIKEFCVKQSGLYRPVGIDDEESQQGSADSEQPKDMVSQDDFTPRFGL